MSSRRSSGSRFPPLSLDFPPPFPSSSSSSTSSNTRIDPGAGILPPPRSRTPSLAGSSFNPSSTFFSSSYRPLSSLDPNNYPSRHGAFSVPPPAFPSSSSSQGKATSSSSNSGITSRMVVCLPCRRGHLKCGKGMRPCQMCIKKGRVEECMEGVPPEQAKLFLRVYYEKKEKELAAGPSLSRKSSSQISSPCFLSPLPFPALLTHHLHPQSILSLLCRLLSGVCAPVSQTLRHSTFSPACFTLSHESTCHVWGVYGIQRRLIDSTER